jgi:hypothetical protein
MKEVAIQQVGLGLPRVQNFSFLSDARVQSPSRAERQERPLLPTSSAQLAAKGLLRVLYEIFKGTGNNAESSRELIVYEKFYRVLPGASSMTLFRANPFSWPCWACSGDSWPAALNLAF